MRGAPRSGLTLIERPKQVEASLWRRLRIEAREDCRQALFSRYLGFARGVAARERRRRPDYGLEWADFQHLAYGGLLEAIDRFDPTLGAPFEAFARHRIRGAIADGATQSSESGAYFRFRQRLEAERVESLRGPDRNPNHGGPRDYLLELSQLTTALAVGLLSEQALTLAVDDGGELDAYGSVAWRDLQLSALREIERLPARERLVLEQHYLHGLLFADIARVMGLTKGRVSQLHRAAISRIRERLRYKE
jgi:RNA polymerase sigma factor FliA